MVICSFVCGPAARAPKLGKHTQNQPTHTSLLGARAAGPQKPATTHGPQTPHQATSGACKYHPKPPAGSQISLQATGGPAARAPKLANPRPNRHPALPSSPSTPQAANPHLSTRSAGRRPAKACNHSWLTNTTPSHQRRVQIPSQTTN